MTILVIVMFVLLQISTHFYVRQNWERSSQDIEHPAKFSVFPASSACRYRMYILVHYTGISCIVSLPSQNVYICPLQWRRE